MNEAERKSGRKTGGKSDLSSDAAKDEEDVGDAFDIWLKRGLHQLYDTVANEPIPDELLRLIEEDRAKRRDQS